MLFMNFFQQTLYVTKIQNQHQFLTYLIFVCCRLDENKRKFEFFIAQGRNSSSHKVLSCECSSFYFVVVVVNRNLNIIFHPYHFDIIDTLSPSFSAHFYFSFSLSFSFHFHRKFIFILLCGFYYIHHLCVVNFI
jgi:hypothetical protein